MSYIKVGQKIWLEPLSNAARYSKDPVEEVITKIGRKYFHTQWKGRFDIQSMNQDNGEYSSQYKAYLNKQDIVDANEIVKLKISIPEKIRYGKLSYQTLLAIERKSIGDVGD